MGRSPTVRRHTSAVILPPLRPRPDPYVNQPKAHRASVPFIGRESQPVYLDGHEIEEYYLDGEPFTMTKVDHENQSEFSRRTHTDRKLTYTLNIVQQPVRARACGAGPRSSADRRPVDPPPVVELRIFEGEKREREVTMSYDACFMLYASLEVSRPIAQGHRYAQPMLPVLTGVAVAGANYLDRPSPAVYFIFPDLSVRHEGWFRLRFSLFESTKHADDRDPGAPLPAQPVQGEALQPSAPQEGMMNRMEVASIPFQVFSAKKFPGLQESTELSRIVAEQGCRVRIRRDVRQRKRVSHKDEDGGYDEERGTYRAASETSIQPHRSNSVSHSQYGGSQDPADHFRNPSFESQYPSRMNSMDSPHANSNPFQSVPMAAPSFAMGPPQPSATFQTSLPPLRTSLDAGRMTPTNHLLNPMPSYPMASDSRSMSHHLSTDLSLPLPSTSNRLPSLPYLFDAQTKTYAINAPVAQKRSCPSSPRASPSEPSHMHKAPRINTHHTPSFPPNYSQFDSRTSASTSITSAYPTPSSSSTAQYTYPSPIPQPATTSASIIEVDTADDVDNPNLSEGDDPEQYFYKRADGTRGNKSANHLLALTGSASASQGIVPRDVQRDGARRMMDLAQVAAKV